VNTSWVLQAETKYITSDLKVIGTTTNKGIFDLGAELSLGFVSAPGFYYTGLATDWQASGNDCSDWTDDFSGAANVGTPGSTTTDAISGSGIGACDGGGLAPLNFILCVEQ